MQLSKFFMKSTQLATTASRFTMRAAPALVTPVTFRSFGHTKYSFDDEDWKPNAFQLSAETHMTNAEELINELPIIQVRANYVRCTGVNEIGLGHPVQYIQLDKRHHNAPITCKWCGLRY